MTSEFGSEYKVRFITSTLSNEWEEWIYVLDSLPAHGEKVICHGSKTFCCELDMEDPTEHEATFIFKENCWKIDKNGNKYDIVTYPCFEIDDKEGQHLIFVSRWKKIKVM